MLFVVKYVQFLFQWAGIALIKAFFMFAKPIIVSFNFLDIATFLNPIFKIQFLAAASDQCVLHCQIG
jgi:hypothetical protein